MRIGPILRRWRINENISQRELARRIGISHSTLCRLEAGENVDGETLAAVICWLVGKDKEQ